MRKIFFYHLLVVSLLYIPLTISLLTIQYDSNADEIQKKSQLIPVESKYVCMVNDQLFQKEQIAVEVDNKTYYGCCKMCEARLKNNPNSRIAVDPVSGQKVDKADSIIGTAPNGKVYYFENINNLEQFEIN